mmetsp:Transcript_5998/g.10660  ORF Transcript_5998/g.10660 Transcript_5998/m.10660 type:complete len:88 (-) Transcript_5998:60-323(-)
MFLISTQKLLKQRQYTRDGCIVMEYSKVEVHTIEIVEDFRSLYEISLSTHGRTHCQSNPLVYRERTIPFKRPLHSLNIEFKRIMQFI